MNHISSFRDLLVWQKSMDLAVRCYKTAQCLPKADQMVLGYQIRKSAVSMPSNVAEDSVGIPRRSIFSTCGRHMRPALNSKPKSNLGVGST